MKSPIIITLFFVAMLTISPHIVIAQEIPDTYGNRLAAAERYLEVASLKDMMLDMILETAKNLPEEVQEPYITLMNKYMRFEVVERAALASMAKHFTVDELNAMADFYASKLGRSAMKKFGAYMGDIMPVIMQEMDRMEKEIEADIERMSKE